MIGEDDGGAGSQGRRTDRGVENIEVDPISHRVERLRKLRFRRPLKVVFATPSRARSLIRSETSREYPRREQLIDEEELKLLGLLEPAANLREALHTVEEDEILGFYDPRSDRLVVIRAGSESRALQEITLAHELTHALEDQHFGISKEDASDDQAAARSALFEGTATALMVDYAGRYLDLSDLAGVLEDVSGTSSELPKFVERQLLFPYEQGESFVSTFRERGNWRAVDQVFRLRHPRSTEQILHPEKYAIDERPTPVRFSGIARRLGREWRRVDATSLGEFDLDSLFRLVGKVKGRAASEGWGGGRFELWRRKAPDSGCKAPCIASDIGLLRVAWDSRRDRKEGEKALRQVFERGLGGKTLDGTGIWSSRGGAIGMGGHGSETTVVLAPSAGLAKGLL